MGVFPIEVGSRIHCEGEYGTVLYVGSITEMEGNWLGVEWDNPSRGKHSGCYKGSTYFTTRIANAGSFIRMSKADSGLSCPAAIRLKYGNDGDSVAQPNFVNLPQKSGTSKYIEIVGMKKIMGKQSKFSQLMDIALSGMLISTPGEENELCELTPNVRSLDLSENLLNSWEDVNQIVKQLPKLSTLILSKNRLKLLEKLVCCKDLYSSLKMLVLNNMDYSWCEILQAAELWPNIEHLCVLDNKIEHLSPPSPQTFSAIKIINLDNNCIRQWNEVIKLGNLEKLEELHLDNISLEGIEFPEVPPSSKTTLFPNLRTLYVKNNQLREWKDVNELNKLSSLKNLMIHVNPVTQTVNMETARQFIIAKILGLEFLNRTKIERSERRGAEFDYLKRYCNDWTTSKASNTSHLFHMEHPTYATLLNKYGAPDEGEVKPQSSLLKDNLICVKIFSPQCPDRPVISRRLPAEMTVGKLKALVQRIFKVAAHEVTLTRLFKQDESQRTEMDNNLRQLSFYSVSDEDKILVEW